LNRDTTTSNKNDVVQARFEFPLEISGYKNNRRSIMLRPDKSIKDFFKLQEYLMTSKRPWRYQNCEFCLDNIDEYEDIVVVEDAEFFHQIKDVEGRVLVEGICSRIEFVQCQRCMRYWFNYFDENGVLIM